MPNISSATTINSVQFTEQSTTPTAPASGYLRLYASTTNSVLRVIDDSGADYQLSTGAIPTDLSTQTFVVLSTSSALANERILTGTANQVTVTDGGAGTTVTLSTPQNLHTGATVQFTTLSVGAAADATASVKISGQYFSPLVVIGNRTTDSTVNWSSGNEHSIELGANITLAFSNPVVGGRYVLLVAQDSTGSRTVTWPLTVAWGNAGAPTLSTTGSTKDLFTFLWDGAEYIGNYSLGF